MRIMSKEKGKTAGQNLNQKKKKTQNSTEKKMLNEERYFIKNKKSPTLRQNRKIKQN